MMRGDPSSPKIQVEQDDQAEIARQNIFKQSDLEAIWLQTMAKCEQFTQQTKKYPSTVANSIEEKRLGKWLSKQKLALNGRGGGYKMTEERRSRLNLYLKDFRDLD